MDGVYDIIAGEGHLYKDLQKIIDDLQISEKVKLLDFREDVAQLYKAAIVAIGQLLSSDLAVMGQYNQKKTEDFSSHNVYATVRNIYGVETNG